jgi:hypothetical protein
LLYQGGKVNIGGAQSIATGTQETTPYFLALQPPFNLTIQHVADNLP